MESLSGRAICFLPFRLVVAPPSSSREESLNVALSVETLIRALIVVSEKGLMTALDLNSLIPSITQVEEVKVLSEMFLTLMETNEFSFCVLIVVSSTRIGLSVTKVALRIDVILTVSDSS